MNFNTELKKNIGCNIVYSSSDGGNYSIILMEFDSGNRIMTYCYWKFRKMENELLHQKMILQLSWFDGTNNLTFRESKGCGS